MGFCEVGHLSHALPDGRVLLDDVSFRVDEGSVTALVGDNGSGKTTLLRLVAGDLPVQSGTVTATGGLGVMRQFVGSVRDDSTVRDLLLSVSPPAVRAAAAEVDALELALMETDDERTQIRYAQALADYGDAGGYDAEVGFDAATVTALGQPYETCWHRPVRQLSGGEQKRLVLEALLDGPAQVLLLDEPDNYLDVRGKTWLEEQLAATRKTVLFVSHDRELLARTATRVVTLEGRDTWVHGSDSRAGRRRGSSGTRGPTTYGGGGTSSTSGCGSWSARCVSRRPTARTWPAATTPCRPGWPGTRRPGRRPRRPPSR